MCVSKTQRPPFKSDWGFFIMSILFVRNKSRTPNPNPNLVIGSVQHSDIRFLIVTILSIISITICVDILFTLKQFPDHLISPEIPRLNIHPHLLFLEYDPIILEGWWEVWFVQRVTLDHSIFHELC